MKDIDELQTATSEGANMLSDSPYALKLIALDNDDLQILSAHLQDAVLRVADMAYVPSDHRFAAILNRFDWLAADNNDNGHPQPRRCRCALRFDRVTRAQVQRLRFDDPNAVAELLAVTYEETDAPSGVVTLYFAGGGAVRLEVECIEAELRDLGRAWRTASIPKHSCLEAEVSPDTPLAVQQGK